MEKLSFLQTSAEDMLSCPPPHVSSFSLHPSPSCLVVTHRKQWPFRKRCDNYQHCQVQYCYPQTQIKIKRTHLRHKGIQHAFLIFNVGKTCPHIRECIGIEYTNIGIFQKLFLEFFYFLL